MLGVILPMVIQVLLLASFGLLEKAVVVLGNVVLETPAAVGVTTMLVDARKVPVPCPQVIATA